MTMLNRLSVCQIVDAIRRKGVKPSEVMSAHLERIRERDKYVGAFQHIDYERALSLAQDADLKESLGALHGVPFAIKDIIDTKNMPTCWGSSIYKGRQTLKNASCVEKFIRAGAIPIGKTVTTEFACFHPGKTANPHNFAHTPGGSSSGSAAAVADFMAPIAFGSQTAASLVRPAAYCGICTIKPTTGAFDLKGVMPLASSLDTLGLLTRNVDDLILGYSVLKSNAYDEQIYFVEDPPRIGLMRGPHWADGDIEMRDVCHRAIKEIGIRSASYGEVAHSSEFELLTDAHISVMEYEAARTRRKEFDGFQDQISPKFQALIERGLCINEEKYQKALEIREQAYVRFDTIITEFDALLVPSAPGPAPKGLDATGDPLFSRMWTLLQVPCIQLPFGLSRKGLPLGIQIIGRRNEDKKLLQVAKWIEGIFTNVLDKHQSS